jgi:hypothetical protein
VFEALAWYQYQLHIMSFIEKSMYLHEEIHELFQKIPISAAVTSDSFFLQILTHSADTNLEQF